MLIAIDGNEANIEKRVGVNQFAFEILHAIFQRISNNEKFLIFLKDKPRKDLPKETKFWKYEVFGQQKFWTWTSLVKRLYFGKPKPDVLFSPSHYGPLFSPIPNIISIMDLGFLRWPDQFTKKDFFQLKYWTQISVKKASKIIAISKFTKQDIVKTYNIKPEKITVAYPGYKKLIVNNEEAKIRDIAKKYNIKSNYILYLGTLKPSKNIPNLLRAIKLLNVQLVIAGKKGWLYQDIFKLVKKLNLQDKVVFTGFVEDNEIPVLMKHAKVFVLPSYWEGFGIPILEAMQAGTPVVCSDRGALPEIVGDATLLINPDSPNQIATAIKKAYFDESIHRSLVEKGKRRVEKFSWDKTAKIILKVASSAGKRIQDDSVGL